MIELLMGELQKLIDGLVDIIFELVDVTAGQASDRAMVGGCQIATGIDSLGSIISYRIDLTGWLRPALGREDHRWQENMPL